MSEPLPSPHEYEDLLRERPFRRGWVQWISMPMLAFLTIPVLVLVLRASPGQTLRSLDQSQVQQAIRVSLATTVVATSLSVLLGTPLAYALAKRRFPFQGIVDTLVDLPTVLPPAVAGVALLMTFGRGGLFGGVLESWGIHVAFTPFAVVLAQMFVAAPLYIKSAALGFAAIDSELEKAAELDGASRWQIFRFVLAPLSWTALLGGTAMTWARAMGEFGATIIFAGNLPGRTQTMPLAIYIGFEIDLEVALTLSFILVAFSFLTLLVVKGILQKEEP